MRISLYDYCKEQGTDRLLRQWHPTRNGALTPRDVSRGSKRKIWWLCEKGHVWQAMVYARADGSGCPYCAGKEAVPGETDFASRYPDLAAQWHPEKNGGLTPDAVLPGSHKKVWWVCERGHEWQAAVKTRVSGCGCPVCANREISAGENDLASLFPAIAAQWHPGLNGALKADGVSPYSNRKVWWMCEKGHAYQAVVGARTVSGSGCPYCAGKKVLAGFNDLATLEPRVAAQWHPTLNGGLTPEMVTVGSHRKVWWQCPEGHIWKSVIHSRAGPKKCGCPVCAGRISHSRQERYRSILAAAGAVNHDGSRV